MKYRPLAEVSPDGQPDWKYLRDAASVKIFGRTEKQLEDVLWVLAGAGGVVTDKSGLTMRKIMQRVEDPRLFSPIKSKSTKSPSGSDRATYTVRRCVQDLAELGLVKYTIRGKRCFRVELLVHPENIGVPDPRPRPEAAPLVVVQGSTDETEPEPGLPAASSGESVVSMGPLTPPVLFDDGDGAMARQVADALLAEVLDRLVGDTASAQLGHVSTQLSKAQDRMRALEKELEIERGKVKAARVEAANEREVRIRTEVNLKHVLDQVKAFQQRSNGVQTDEQRQVLDRMIRAVPNFPDRQTRP